MSANKNLILSSELGPVAKRMRERAELLAHGIKEVQGRMCDVLAVAIEQGQDITLVKAKLGKVMTWEDWRQAHVPNMSPTLAAGCERMSKENNERRAGQVFFNIIVPEPPQDESAVVKRVPPNEHEAMWALCEKLVSIATPERIQSWSAMRVEMARKELEPLARALWPQRFA